MFPDITRASFWLSLPMSFSHIKNLDVSLLLLLSTTSKCKDKYPTKCQFYCVFFLKQLNFIQTRHHLDLFLIFMREIEPSFAVFKSVDGGSLIWFFSDVSTVTRR